MMAGCGRKLPGWVGQIPAGELPALYMDIGDRDIYLAPNAEFDAVRVYQHVFGCISPRGSRSLKGDADIHCLTGSDIFWHVNIVGSAHLGAVDEYHIIACVPRARADIL